MAATFTIAITEEELAAAIKTHADASNLRKRAEKMEKDARAVILAYKQQFEDAGTKNITVIRRGDYQTDITTPFSAPVPEHFDQTKAAELRNFLHDAYPEHSAQIEAYFDAEYTFDLERFLAGGKMLPEDLIAAICEGARRRMIPAQEGQPMSPRLVSKKVQE